MNNRNQAIAWLAAIAFALGLAPSAQAQYITKPFYLSDDAEYSAELHRAGLAMRRGLEHSHRGHDHTYLIVRYSERDVEYLDVGTYQPTKTDHVSIKLIVSLGILPEEDSEEPVRGLTHIEHFRIDKAESYFRTGELPSVVMNNVDDILAMDEDSYAWELVLCDGEQEYHWTNHSRQHLRSHYLADDIGMGLSLAPYNTKPGPPTNTYPFTRPPLDSAYEFGMLKLYRDMVDFAVAGRTDQNYVLEYGYDELNSLDTIKFSTSFSRTRPAISELDYNNSEMTWEASTRHGLPTSFEQYNTYMNDTFAFMSHRWSLDTWRSGKGELIAYPRAFDVLISSHHPPTPIIAPPPRTIEPDAPPPKPEITGWLEVGMQARRYRAIILHAEFDEPSHLDHPALKPDSLAAWLGVALRWTNPEGATVTSVPPDADQNHGVPHCELLMDIRERIASGDLVVEWPFGEPDLPTQ